MKTIKTYLPVFTGFYGSHFLEPYMDEEDEGKEIDWEAYMKALSKSFCDVVEDELSDFVSMIKFERLVSPKYYNYANDSINVEIDVYVNKVNEYIKENIVKFDKYLKDNYTSCDGFISSYSTDVYDWLDWSDDKHKAGSVLQFICNNEGITEDCLYDTGVSYYEYIID
jgi:hypothetical protein